ncbi:T9SS type A sorting domain-containing protein [Flavitalea flava]
MRLTYTTIRGDLFLLLILSLCCFYSSSSANRIPDNRNRSGHPGMADHVFAGPASGVNFTWNTCTAGTLLNSSAAGTATYTFGPGDCDGNAFTAICECTGASANSQARVLISITSGNNILRFDRNVIIPPAATFTKARFKSTAGDAFKLTNLTVFPVNSASQTMTVTAYRNGVAVTGSAITINYVTSIPIHGTTLTSTDFGSNYDNMDEIQVTTSTGIGVSLDNIQTSNAVILPLSLLDFSGRQEGKSVLLNWSTASEENTLYFEIQRSLNDSAFSPLAKVPAAGNSSGALHYNYTDNLPFSTAISGKAYLYRLKMADLDGKFTFSPVVAINTLPSVSGLTVGPNPFIQQVTILFGSFEPDNAVFTITDRSGRRLSARTFPIQKGNNKITLSGLGQLGRGIYLLTMTTKGQTQTVELIKGQ